MANKRREENRKRSSERGGAMSQRESTHREPRYRGEGSEGAVSRSSGSHAHVGERRGPGEVPGAGELGGIAGPGPGRSAETKAGMRPESFPSRKTPGAQKNVPDRSRGQEED